MLGATPGTEAVALVTTPATSSSVEPQEPALVPLAPYSVANRGRPRVDRDRAPLRPLARITARGVPGLLRIGSDA